MSQQDFEPDANEFTAAPEFTEADFSTPGHDTWTSTEHPGHAGQDAPGAWGSPQEYVQPEDMNGQGVFVPGHDDPWGTEPTPPSGTPRHRSTRRTQLGPLAMTALAVISVCAVAVIAIPYALAIRRAPADDPGATASQHAPSVRSGSSSPAAEPPAITRTGAERVLTDYWRVNNAANQSRSDTLLATIEAGSSYAIDAGTYQMSRVTDPSDSQYAPFSAGNAVYYIPRQPAGVYPRWFAARVTYATLASPQHATGTGYVLFIQNAKDAAWKNVLEPYLLTAAGPAPFIQTDAQGYAVQAPLTSAARLAAAPARIPQLTAESLDGATAAVTVRNPGNLADLRDQVYFQSRLPAGIGRHRPARHGRPGLRPEDGRRRRAGLLPPHRAAQPRPASGPDHQSPRPRLLLPQPGPHLRGGRLRGPVRRLPPSRLCCPRRHRRRLRYHRAGLTANQPDLASSPPCPRIWAQADPRRCAGGPGRIATCPTATRTVRR